MPATLNSQDFCRMLTAAAASWRANAEFLSRLDSATGDGDHGTTMKKVADAIEASVKDDTSATLAALLSAAGWAVMSVDGGSTSPLFGSLLLGMGDAAEGKDDVSVADLAGLFEAGTTKLRELTPAQPGDKTLLDALLPAVAAIRAAADRDVSIENALKTAAEAAARGAESTKGMQARFGRARNLGARTLGHVDPGATSIALMLSAFSDC